MGRKRIVLTLTVAEYLAAKEYEEAASKSPFTYNTRTQRLSVDIPALEKTVVTAKKSKRVCRESEKAFTVADLN